MGHKVPISRTDSLLDVKGIIQRKLAEEGNPINEWGKSNMCTIRSPFSAEDPNGDNFDEIIILDENRPIVQYNVQPGSEIVITGALKLESDKPKMCFTATYKQGAIT